MTRIKDMGIAGQFPKEPRHPHRIADNDDFDGEDSSQFDDWKHTVLAYGLVAIGTCIVIYGVVGQ